MDGRVPACGFVHAARVLLSYTRCATCQRVGHPGLLADSRILGTPGGTHTRFGITNLDPPCSKPWYHLRSCWLDTIMILSWLGD